ncbi:DUF58 domain-containing protein [Phenylobacterium sp.]|uniref:DUF58 domain-containing protein n=1 Tax=Phenylobacterium sp. TaxID=1871053 RepID=UPI0025F6FEC9|nr:DUF58 domain-containing protein [Phenylobacterium sp.]MBX3485121.1 DUF58 domain-containing protein [Phenylobacterium sp.]
MPPLFWRKRTATPQRPDSLAEPLNFDALFEPAFLTALQPFALRINQAQKGGRLAEHRTAARGQGTEFVDFKPYAPGDDLRAIDWNIYRRLGRVFVRAFEERQDMPVYFLIDRSRSLYIEDPPRIHAGLRATLALAAVALEQHDSVRLFPFSDGMTPHFRTASGKAALLRVAHSLAGYEAAGGTDLAASLTHLTSLNLRQGLVVVVSDFFNANGVDPVVHALEHLRHRVLLVQLTKHHDADPSLHPGLFGDVVIEDGETGSRTPVTVTPDLVGRYKAAYRHFNDRLTQFANRRGAGLARLDADKPVLDQLSLLFGTGGTAL